MDTPVIAPEVAEEEFNRFCENMDIDNRVDDMTNDDSKGFIELKNVVIRAVMEGRLVFNDDGEPVYTTKHGGTELVFREPTGAMYMAMDRQKEGNNVGKMMALLDAMTKSTPGTGSKLKGVDFKTARSIMSLFMA